MKKTSLSVNCYQGPVSHNQCKLCPDSLDKVLFWVKFQMIMGSLNYKLYTTKGKLEFVKRGVIPIKLMVMISFIFFSG
jgi:hypothetical protein